MIVVCVDNKKYEDSLTLNKSYEFENKGKTLNERQFGFRRTEQITIINDDNILSSYRADRFISLEKFREEQLKKLGI